MPAADWEFYLKHLDRKGVTKTPRLNPVFIEYTITKYGGSLRFGLDAVNPVVDTLTDYDLIEVWVRNLRLGIKDVAASNGRGYVRENMVFILREWFFNTDDDLITFWTGVCVSHWNLLDFPFVAWHSNVDNRSVFTNVPAETIGKLLVQYNATALALKSNGRWRDYDLAAGMGFPVSVEADKQLGNLVSRNLRQGTLLGILQALALKAGGDFTMTRSGPAAWSFGFNLGQQGKDKFDTVIFSLDKKNMVRPTLYHRAIGAATVAVSAGQGEDSARVITDPAIEGAGFAPNNDIEMYVDARDIKDPGLLPGRAEEKLEEQKAMDELTYQVAQVPDTFRSPIEVPGRHTYDVGDIGQAQYQGTRRREITAVTVAWGANALAFIEIETQDE